MGTIYVFELPFDISASMLYIFVLMDWSDIRVFLATAEAGSLSGAARRLKTSQPTVGRRIAALEDALGAPLFIRSRKGLQITEHGEQILEHARRMDLEASSVELLSAGSQQGLTGKVVISVIESMGAGWLTGALLKFQRANPGITIEINIDKDSADILRREADIAVRMYQPRQLDLIAKKVGTMGYGLFGSEDYLAEFGAPRSTADLVEHAGVMPTESILQFIAKKGHVGEMRYKQIAFQSNSMMSLAAATRAGYGISGHSFLLASQYPELKRVIPELTLFEMDFWLVTHPDLRKSARIRATWNYLTDLFRNNRDFIRYGPGGLAP